MLKVQKWSWIISVLLIFGGIKTVAANQMVDKTIGKINHITLNCSADLFIAQGDMASLKIDADASTLKKIIVKENNGVLYLDVENRSWFYRLLHKESRLSHINFYLTINDVEQVVADGAGSIIFGDTIKLNNINIITSGDWNVSAGYMACNDIDCELNGNGGLTFKTLKVTNGFAVKISGDGNIGIDSLSAKQSNFKVDGSGKVEVKDIKTDLINSKISGDGILTFSGQSRRQDCILSGSAKYYAQNLQTNYANIKAEGDCDVKITVSKNADTKSSGNGNIQVNTCEAI